MRLHFRLCSVIWIGCVAGGEVSWAQESGALRYEHSTRFSSDDYLLRSREDRKRSVFESYKPIDLGINLGVGADCGRVDVSGTLRSTLNNMLNSEYFGDLGRNILASSPLLATCYFSPTWCAILKHSQLSANFVSQMRLDQCSLIDKFVDSRTEDFYQERQACVHGEIEKHGGDLEAAMRSCRNVWDADLSDWSGESGGKVTKNQLVESSAAWAGIKGKDAEDAIQLVKAFVGDTVISKHGGFHVDYGPRGIPLTPERHLKGIQAATETKLCDELVERVRGERQRGVEAVVSADDLKALGGGADAVLVDRQTIEALSFLPYERRRQACRKLSDAVALSIATRDFDQSLGILNAASQNPHLPPKRREEIESKRRALRESVELTLELQKQRNEPLNRVSAQINAEGERYRGDASESALSNEAATIEAGFSRGKFMDCADGIMCEGR